MINPLRQRRFGLFLIILAYAGMLFSLTGIIITWIVRPKIQSSLGEGIAIVKSSLLTTDSGLQIVDQSITNAKSNLTILQSALDDLSLTLNDVSTSLETSATLIGNDLRLTVINTQVALSSAATSAEIIDDTLSFIAAIPLLGADYQPEVPLHVSLNQIADDMDDVPDTLLTLEGNLNETSASLDVFSEQLNFLSMDLENFSSDLRGIQDTLYDYTIIVDHAQVQLDSFESHLSGILVVCCIFLSGMLLWLGVAQINILFQGLALRNNEMKVVNLADLRRE